MERLESGVRIIIAFIEALNNHDLPAMLKLVSEDCILEASFPAPEGVVLNGKPALTEYWQDFFTESPDAHLKIEEAFGFGQRCLARWRGEWTDTTGKPTHLRGIDIFRVQNGLITEQLTYVKG